MGFNSSLPQLVWDLKALLLLLLLLLLLSSWEPGGYGMEASVHQNTCVLDGATPRVSNVLRDISGATHLRCLSEAKGLRALW